MESNQRNSTIFAPGTMDEVTEDDPRLWFLEEGSQENPNPSKKTPTSMKRTNIFSQIKLIYYSKVNLI